jgi:hypothetical protein
MVSAPFHAWDALICPSRAIRDVTLRLIEQQQAFAVERYGARALDLPQLPVIPLAVAANDFDGLDGLRNKARQKLGIDRHDVACVYVGRLSMHAKANPAPMLMALERAAAHVPHGGKMAMLFVGWFANDRNRPPFARRRHDWPRRSAFPLSTGARQTCAGKRGRPPTSSINWPTMFRKALDWPQSRAWRRGCRWWCPTGTVFATVSWMEKPGF